MYKIKNSRFKTFNIIITSFSMDKKDEKSGFFEETLLVAQINIDVAFEISFLILGNIRINIINWEFE